MQVQGVITNTGRALTTFQLESGYFSCVVAMTSDMGRYHRSQGLQHQAAPIYTQISASYGVSNNAGHVYISQQQSSSPPSKSPTLLQDPPMTTRHIQMDVLSAERFDDGVSPVRRPNSRKKRQASGERVLYGGLVESTDTRSDKGFVAHSAGGGDGTTTSGRGRKKPKLSDEEEEERRSRGRPRLDTKDETAADRRRTQIRLAQRAYRNRKETTIVELEKKVQELRGTNEEMSNIFMSLYDFAIKKGLVEREPEFARHLRSTTSQFLALAASAGDENIKEEDAILDIMKSNAPALLDRESAPENTQHNGRQELQDMPSTDSAVWGYEIMHNGGSSISQIDYKSQSPPMNPHNDHLVIARATPENASFSGFDANVHNNDIQQWRMELPETTEVFSQQQYMEIHEALPLPASYAHTETSFARRLTRYSAERAYNLLKLEHIAPRRFNEVFAFCLQFSTTEKIAARLERILAAPVKGSIYAWNEPFVHLGGAGTYYPNYDETATGLMPKFRTGMSMGPFDERVSETRSKSMVDDYRMSLPGFTGEFFDANDVESYLFNKGIDLSANPDFISVNLEQLMLSGSEDTLSTHAPLTPRESVDSKVVDHDIRVLDTLIAQTHEPQAKTFDGFHNKLSFELPEWTMTEAGTEPAKAVDQSLFSTALHPKLSGKSGFGDFIVDNSVRLSSGYDGFSDQSNVTLSIAVLINGKCLRSSFSNLHMETNTLQNSFLKANVWVGQQASKLQA